jgi:arylsulfatase A-like enzyme
VLLCAALAAGGCSDGPARPNDIVLVTLDTTRRDHLGVYGYERPVSPHLDAFAERADLYTRAYASSSWTVPTHASILTRLHASDHGAHLGATGGMAHRLRDDVGTLGERLRARGYATAAIVGAHTLNVRFGLGRGFDLYDAPAGEDILSSRKADVLTRRALAWLDERSNGPVFLFVNYFDPHIPYRPPEPCHSRLAAGIAHHGPRAIAWHRRPLRENLALYDAEICFMDEQFNRLMEGLRARGRFKTALVAVVADHGERFDPVEGIVHGRTLGEALIHVSLFLKHPRQHRGRVVEKPFEARRLFQLMLAASGARLPETAPDSGFERRLLVSELWRGGPEKGNPVLRALIRWPLKLVVPPEGPPALYDLSSVAGETDDLAASRARERAELEALLAAWVARRGAASGAPVELDPALREKLRALGYAL